MRMVRWMCNETLKRMNSHADLRDRRGIEKRVRASGHTGYGGLDTQREWREAAGLRDARV